LKHLSYFLLTLLTFTSTLTQAHAITVGGGPIAAAFDSHKNEIFVGNYGSGTVSVISDATNTAVATTAFPGAPGSSTLPPIPS